MPPEALGALPSLPETGGGRRASWNRNDEAARLLREARELAGLSQRALAARMGLSWVTVRQAEMGRDLRHSTLERYLAALPTLSADALVLGRAHGVPPCRRDVWEALRALAGFWSARVIKAVEVAPDGARRELVRVAGLRSEHGDAGEATVRRDLMMAACEGSGTALPLVLAAAADPRPETLRFRVADMRHDFRLGRRGGIDYRCLTMAPARAEGLPSRLDPAASLALGLFVRASHPTRRISLRLRLPHGALPAGVRVVAWPEALLPGEGDLAARHHGGPVPVVLRRAGNDVAFTVEHPLPGTCYAACWDSLDGSAADESAPAPGATLGQRLAAARRRAGLSRRGLAAAMGASDMLVRTAEAGRDVRRSTLQGCVRALPGLRPEDLLRLPASDAPVSLEELWHHVRDVFGCEAEEEHALMVVRANGDCEMVRTVRGLRCLPGRERDLRLMDPQQPSYYPHAPPRCRRIDAPDGDAEDIRTRLHHLRDGRIVQEVVVPEALARAGAAFRREVVREGVFHVTAERARVARGTDEGPFLDGATLFSMFPARRRVLEVRFPEGYWPRRITAHAWPASMPPYPGGHEAVRALHPRGLRPKLVPDLSRVVLAIDRPQVGFKHALLWELP